MTKEIDWSDVSKLHIESDTGAKIVRAVPHFDGYRFVVAFDRAPTKSERVCHGYLFRQDGTHDYGRVPPITNVGLPAVAVEPFVVWAASLGAKGPYTTREEAEREAERFAQKNPGQKFYVMGSLSVSAVEKVQPPVNTTRLAA